MKKGSSKYYFAPDEGNTVTGLVRGQPKETIQSTSQNTDAAGGMNVENGSDNTDVDMDAVLTLSTAAYLTFVQENGNWLTYAEFMEYEYDPSSNTIEGVGSGTIPTSIDSSITEILLKDALLLAAGDQQADDYYLSLIHI